MQKYKHILILTLKMLIIILLFIYLFSANLFSANVALADFKMPVTIQALIKNYEHQQKTLHAGAMALLYKDRVIYKNTFGKQKNNIGDITSKTLFPLASVSKPVTAIAIALMVENKKLNLENKFKLPYLQHSITIKNILSHTTGYKFSGNGYIEQGIKRSRLLNILKKYRPECHPNKCYKYSNTMFSLISEALTINNLTLTSVIHSLQTKLDSNGIQMLPVNAPIAFPHKKQINNGKTLYNSLPFPSQYIVTVPASAGVLASLDGMIEFAKLSFGYKPDLISQATLNYIYTPVLANRDIDRWNIEFPVKKNNIKSYYALGWRILQIKEIPNTKLIFHSGYINGIRAFIGFVPSKELSIIILGNQNDNFPLKYGLNIWHKILAVPNFALTKPFL